MSGEQTGSQRAGGAPWFEELQVGQVDRSAPSVTLTDGMAAVHQAILGDRLALALDGELAARVLGRPGRLAHPGLVWDVAIGQSTVLTGRVIANLFYRGLVFLRAPMIGDTLTTSVEVVARRETSRRPGRSATGLAVLRIRSSDQEGRAVLDFWRCAMLPLRDADSTSGASDSFEQIPEELPAAALGRAAAGWDLAPLREAAANRGPGPQPGARVAPHAGDVVSGAPELARLTLNVAAAHHDRRSQPAQERLVYGGHTIGLAAAQASRALPEIVTIVGWHSCDHLAPVREGDTLHSEIEVESVQELDDGALAHLRSRVVASRGVGEDPVLDWRFVALLI
jgi:acyl dehydratase